MLLVVAFASIGLLWMYARGLSQKLEELRNLMFEQGVELRDAEGQPKILQRTATVVSVPSVPPARRPQPNNRLRQRAPHFLRPSHHRCQRHPLPNRRSRKERVGRQGGARALFRAGI